MKAKQLKELLNQLSEEELDLEVMSTDPDRSGIISPVCVFRIVTVEEELEYAWSERNNCNFPIGYKFLKLI